MKWIKMRSIICFFIVFAAMFSITTYSANANSGETILPDVSNSKNLKNAMLKGLWESNTSENTFKFDGISGVKNADNDSGTYEFDGERLVLTINGKTLKAGYWSMFGGSNLDFEDNHTERYRLFDISKYTKFDSSDIWTSNGSDKYIFERDFTYTVQGRGEAFDGYSGKGSYAFTDEDNGTMTEDGRKPLNFHLPTGDSTPTPDHVLTITAENGEVTRLKFSYESLSTKYGTLRYQLEDARALEGDSYIKFTSANEVTIYDANTGETRTGTYRSIGRIPSEIVITIDGKEIVGEHRSALGNYWKFEDLGSGWFVYN